MFAGSFIRVLFLGRFNLVCICLSIFPPSCTHENSFILERDWKLEASYCEMSLTTIRVGLRFQDSVHLLTRGVVQPSHHPSELPVMKGRLPSPSWTLASLCWIPAPLTLMFGSVPKTYFWAWKPLFNDTSIHKGLCYDTRNKSNEDELENRWWVKMMWAGVEDSGTSKTPLSQANRASWHLESKVPCVSGWEL